MPGPTTNHHSVCAFNSSSTTNPCEIIYTGNNHKHGELDVGSSDSTHGICIGVSQDSSFKFSCLQATGSAALGIHQVMDQEALVHIQPEEDQHHLAWKDPLSGHVIHSTPQDQMEKQTAIPPTEGSGETDLSATM